MALRKLLAPLGKTYRESCGHRKYGLFYEDLFIETVTVQEALRRLPDDVLQARLRRMKTASQCYVTDKELPREKWVTDATDLPYLSPYVKEVEREDHDRTTFWLK